MRCWRRWMAGCVICSRRLRRAGALKTMAPSRFRSRKPSAFSTSAPNSATISARAGCPGITTSRARRSASTTFAPRWANIWLTVLLPVAMPPVSPTRRKRLIPPPRPRSGARWNLRMPSPRGRTASCLRPVRPRLHVDLERHAEREGPFHHLDDEGLEGLELPLGDLEEQLIVHLEQHAAAEAPRGQLA